VVAGVDDRGGRSTLQAQPPPINALGNGLVELYCGPFTGDDHDDGVASGRRDADADHVRLIGRDVFPRNEFKLGVNLDHRSPA
jgi:hypothetical protein